MSRYFQPRWAYLCRSVSTTSYFGAAGQVSLCGRRGHSPGSRPAAPRAGDSRPRPRGGAARARGGVEGDGPGQRGRDVSPEMGTSTPGTPVNLCPESVTSSCCGSLPGAKNSSFSFESFLVSGSSRPPRPHRPAETKRGGRPGGKLERQVPWPPSPLRKGGAHPAARLGGGEAGLRGLSELLLNAQEVKLVVLGVELGRRLKKRHTHNAARPESNSV